MGDNPEAMRRADIPVLTTLRFPAAFAIVLYHFLAYTTCPAWIWDGFNAGVSFFYVLSGFILYYNYPDLKDRGYFWIARLARIWPVHLFTLVLALIVMPWDHLLGHASWPVTLPANIFLVHAWLPIKGSVLSFNGVSWSLSVEAFFYLCFPWILVGMNRRGSPLFLAGSFSIGFAIILLVTLFWPAQAAYFGNFNPVCRLFEFVLGMASCKYWLQGPRAGANSSQWLGYELIAVLLSLILVIGIPVLLMAAGIVNAATSWIGAELCALGFAMLIWVFAHQAGAISQALSKRWLTWLGEISFAVYMCHQIILRRLVPVAIDNVPAALETFGVVIVLTLIVAAAIFHLVETPSRHAIVSAYKRFVPRPVRA